jgi:integrase
MATFQRRGARWRAQVRRRGLKPLSKTFEKHEDAARWAQTVEGRLAVGDVLDLSEARRTTLGEALERYLAEATPLKKGAKQERVRIQAWLRDPLANRPLASIRSMDIAAWRNERVVAGKAPTTVRNALTIISQVFQVAGTEWGMQGLQNPVRGVRMPRSRPARDRRLEPGEEERVLAGCDAAGQRLMRPIVIWALETAMRQGEILALEARSIRGNVAYLHDTKTTRARSVPLSTRALRVLDGLAVPLRGPLFPITQDSLEYFWRKALRIAGIAGLRFHDLRHEATSRLFERGLDSMEVMSITGHSTTDMLKRYTHFRAADLVAKLG